MGLPERIKAAALLAKFKLILIRDLPKARPRIAKWDALVDALQQKTAEASQGCKSGKDRTGANPEILRRSLMYAGDAENAAKDYAKELEKISILIKRVSLLKDTTKKINIFIKEITKVVKKTNATFKDYKNAKLRFKDVFDPNGWDDRLLRWLPVDNPQWNQARISLAAFVKYESNVEL
jgi:hypothetical protein